MIIPEGDWLEHYGILRKSGRYPWGSGGHITENTRNKQFMDYVNEMKKGGMSESTIAQALGITTTELRVDLSYASNSIKQENINRAQKLRDKGWGPTAIAKEMGTGESTVRSWLAPGAKDKADALQTTADMLKRQVAEKGIIDIGSGVENQLGLSSTRLQTAVGALRAEGYAYHNVQVAQAGTSNKTTVKVLAKEGTTYRDVVSDLSKIRQIQEFSEDNGRSFLGIHPPIAVNPNRVAVRYAEKGGKEADGVIYLRPGVEDLSMGGAPYGQVRIQVGEGHYLKGMAMYKPDLPKGVDLEFNTNKSDTGNKLDALKKISEDPDNPFTSTIRQDIRRDKNGKEYNASAINIVGNQNKPGSGVEGNWDSWSRSLSSQMLSKQQPKLAKEQLAKHLENNKADLDRILALTNPTVKKTLLDKFADQVDSDTVHLKAAPLPGQSTHVILPIKSMKETEVYAPNYKNGETVVLIRHPHGGKFEIPELTVNNNHREAKSMLGQAKDAIGINHKVAEKLSGADFDGDTVIVIPNNSRKIKSQPALEGLKGFDAQRQYKLSDDVPRMKERVKQIQMGDVSNLITDMTIRGANDHELAAAVRHSMVVIDAAKHHLDYKRSAQDNGIKHLKEKYQDTKNGSDKGPRGKSTVISRSKSEIDVPTRRLRNASEGGSVDSKGRPVYVNKNETKVNRKGQTVVKTEKAKSILEIDDAHKLSSGMPIEKVYADHANSMKALANRARLASSKTKPVPMSKGAKQVYSKEVASLNAKLDLAIQNRPTERAAQLAADTVARAKKDATPGLTQDQLSKVRGQALVAARVRLGAKTPKIDISDNEWEAIQAGAVSTHKLEQMLAKADLDRVRQLATPKTKVLMSGAKLARAQALLASGATQAEVAQALGVSLTTLKEGIK